MLELSRKERNSEMCASVIWYMMPIEISLGVLSVMCDRVGSGQYMWINVENVIWKLLLKSNKQAGRVYTF